MKFKLRNYDPVEAMQFVPEQYEAVARWCHGKIMCDYSEDGDPVVTLYAEGEDWGDTEVSTNWWVIKMDDYYNTMADKHFKEVYEQV